MATILHFTDKSGRSASIRFPDRHTAEVYARGVKNPTFQESDMWVDTNVTRCGTPAQENYKRRKNALLSEEVITEEEMEANAYVDACKLLLSGDTSPEAQAARVVARTNTYKVEAVCACGRECGPKHTSCYICRRYG